MVENNIQIRVFTKDINCVDVDGREIGNGYVVGPGHGIIVSKIGDDYEVRFNVLVL